MIVINEVKLGNEETSYEEVLVRKFLTLDAEAKELASRYNEKKKERDIAEADLLDLLNDENKKSSGRFKGLGHVTSLEPTVSNAYILQGQENELFDYLRSIDRADLIKTGVHHSSLASFINQKLKSGEEPPPGVGYVLKQKLRGYPEKKRSE